MSPSFCCDNYCLHFKIVLTTMSRQYQVYIGTYLIIDGPMKFVTTSIRSTIWNLYIRDARSTSKILNIGRVRVGIICILIDAFRIWQNWMSICNACMFHLNRAWIEKKNFFYLTQMSNDLPMYLPFFTTYNFLLFLFTHGMYKY